MSNDQQQRKMTSNGGSGNQSSTSEVERLRQEVAQLKADVAQAHQDAQSARDEASAMAALGSARPGGGERISTTQSSKAKQWPFSVHCANVKSLPTITLTACDESEAARLYYLHADVVKANGGPVDPTRCNFAVACTDPARESAIKGEYRAAGHHVPQLTA